MRYEVLYQPSYSLARINLEQGEAIMAEAGAMAGMSPTIRIETKMSGGGLMGAVKSSLGGESLFRNTYRAENGPGEVLLAPSGTGDIMAVELQGQKLYVQGGSYLAGDPRFEISVEGSPRAMFAGEGLFLLTVTGTGPLFLSSFGAIHVVELGPGEEYILDTTHMVAFDSSVTYKLEKASGKSEGVGGFLKGVVQSALSGEGLVARYKGPGKVYMQTRSFKNFIQLITPFLPKKS